MCAVVVCCRSLSRLGIAVAFVRLSTVYRQTRHENRLELGHLSEQKGRSLTTHGENDSVAAVQPAAGRALARERTPAAPQPPPLDPRQRFSAGSSSSFVCGHLDQLCTELSPLLQKPAVLAGGDRRAGGRTTLKLPSRSQSPAAKSRQAQIDRDNLILIKKIIALDNSSSISKKPPHHKTGQAAAITGKEKKKTVKTARAHWCTVDAPNITNAVVVSAGSAVFSTHGCVHPLPDVPSSASHALYTHGSATMRNNFADTNSSTLQLSRRQSARLAHGKLQDENKKLLQRILTARTSYSRAQWSKQERERRELLRNISRRPSASLSHGSASTSRLRSCPDTRTSNDVVSLSLSSATRQTRSSSELATMTAVGIRLDSTSFLDARQQLRQHQRPLSASARPSARGVAVASWTPTKTDRQPSRKPASESIVQRMRTMTIHQRECEADEEGSDSGSQERGISGVDEDEDEDDILLRELN